VGCMEVKWNDPWPWQALVRLVELPQYWNRFLLMGWKSKKFKPALPFRVGESVQLTKNIPEVWRNVEIGLNNWHQNLEKPPRIITSFWTKLVGAVGLNAGDISVAIWKVWSRQRA